MCPKLGRAALYLSSPVKIDKEQNKKEEETSN